MKQIKKLLKGQDTPVKTLEANALKKRWDKFFREPLQNGNPPSPITKDDFAELKEDVQEINLKLMEVADANSLVRVQYLKDSVPNPISTTIFGIEDIEPNDFEKFKFIEVVRSVFHPDYLLESAEHGALSNYVVDTLKAVHPNYLEGTKLILSELIIEYRANPKKAPTNLDRVKQSIIAKIFEQPRFSIEVMQQFQANFESKEQGGSSAPNLSEGAETTQQRIQNK